MFAPNNPQVEGKNEAGLSFGTAAPGVPVASHKNTATARAMIKEMVSSI